jgi:hypothetical protein
MADQEDFGKVDINKVIAIIIGALLVILLLAQVVKKLAKKIPSETGKQITPAALTVSPIQTKIPPKPTITYQKLPFSKTDKTRKVEIIGCLVSAPEVGYTYSKKVVEIPNTKDYLFETMKAFLEEASQTGWGGFPTKEEDKKFEEIRKKVDPGFSYKYGEVKLLSLSIDKTGYTRVNFSKEAEAYGGGAARVACISDSVAITLQQFPEVKFVSLCIEGDCTDQKGSTVFQP